MSMLLGETVPAPRSAYCGWKALSIISLLGFAAFLTLPHFYAEDTAVTMAVAPSAIKAPMQAPKAWQFARARQFMQPMSARQPVDVSALRSPDDYPVTAAESSDLANQGRRDMLAKIAKTGAAFGLAAAASQDKAALAEEGKRDGRLGLLALIPAVAVGWVGFNILGPGTDQLDEMAAKNKAREAPKRR